MLKNRNSIKAILIAALALVCFSINAYSATNQHFKLTAKPSVLSVKAGESFWIKLTVSFDKGWHSYANKKIVGPLGIGPEPTSFRFEPKSAIQIDGKTINPKFKKKYDEGFETNIELLEGVSNFEIPVKAKKDIDFSKEKITAVVTAQQCDETSCLPTTDFKVTVSKEIYTPTKAAPEAAPEEVKEEPAPVQNTQPAQQPAPAKVDNKKAEQAKPQANGQSDLLTMIIVSALAGFGAFITPCVFPMVPITVSFFTKRNEQTKGKGLRDAIIYALGIIITFTAVGLLFAAIMGPAGAQQMAGNPWFNLAIVAIFLLFGFSLFGAYEIQLPTSWSNKLNAKSMSSQGISSVILMSITFALTSFSCTGPLISAALVSASTGEWFYPAVSMISFSTTLSAPFFLLALFPSALNSLPRAGGWMNNVKVVLGFIVLAITMKYLNNALIVWNMEIPRDLFLSLWIGIALLLTLYILGVFKTSHDSPVDRVGTLRLVFAIVFAGATFYLVSGFAGKQLGFLESFLPMPDETAVVATVGGAPAAPAHAVWMDSYKAATEAAIKDNKYILVDFTGKTCTNCKVMKKKVILNAKVQPLLSNFALAELYTDDKVNYDIQMRLFNSVALPLYAIIDPNGEKIIAKIEFTSDVDEFIKFLDNGIKK